MKKYLNIVAGIDGTWNDESSNTNVYKLLGNVCENIFYNLKDRDERCLTKVNYERGLGTSPTTRYTDGALAKRLHEPIGRTYDWLASKLVDDNGEFVPRLYLFGFSRGTYCMHVLSWLLQEVGVPMRTDYAKQIAEAYVAKDENALGEIVRQAECISSPRIQMLGLWDTVTAPCDVCKHYHDGMKSPLVDMIHHALAANEARTMFPVMQYSDPTSQHAHQVWFSGVHGDVGGMQDYEKYLSDITLNWMECQAYAEGIGFKPPPVPMTVYDFDGMSKSKTDDEEANRTYLKGEGIHVSLLDRMKYDEGYYPKVHDLLDNLKIARIEHTKIGSSEQNVSYV